jgi:hypothetical protein
VTWRLLFEKISPLVLVGLSHPWIGKILCDSSYDLHFIGSHACLVRATIEILEITQKVTPPMHVCLA